MVASIVDEVDGEVDEPTVSSAKVEVYKKIILHIFQRHYRPKTKEFVFDREEIAEAAQVLGVPRPKNLGDVIYAFRYRRPLPPEIVSTQPKDRYWLILGAGDAKYRFRLSSLSHVEPTRGLLVRKVPDSTPQIILRRALNDEQALLAKVRYNRLVDIFLAITAYSLQNHLRTKIPNYGQIEVDELYVGVDSKGAQYIVPVQAKGGRDKLGVIQTIQDTTFCSSQPRYSGCVVRTVSAQFMDEDVIAMFELKFDGNDVSIVQEKHYSLVPSDQITSSELEGYKIGG